MQATKWSLSSVIFLILSLVGRSLIQRFVKIIEVLIPIIICREFGEIFLPAPRWHLLKLKIEVLIFDHDRAVSHWIDSVRCCRCRCRRHCYLCYISICSILQRSWTGRVTFVLEPRCNREQEFYLELLLNFLAKVYNLLLDFRQSHLNSDIWHPKGF